MKIVARADVSAEDNERIRALIGQLMALIYDRGAISEPVRQLIREHAHVGDFKQLAFTVILLAAPKGEMLALSRRMAIRRRERN